MNVTSSSYAPVAYYGLTAHQEDADQEYECLIGQLSSVIHNQIIKYLDAPTAARFSLTSRAFAAQIQTNDIWQRFVNCDFKIAYNRLAALESLPSDQQPRYHWFKLYKILYRKSDKGRESWCKSFSSDSIELFQSLATLNNDYLLLGGYKHVYVWSSSSNTDSNTKITLERLEGHEDTINCIAGIGEDRFVTSSRDGTVRLWSLRDKTFHILERHEKEVTALALLPNDQIATVSYDFKVRIRSILGEHAWTILTKSPLPLNCLTVLPNDRLVIACLASSRMTILPLDGKEPQIVIPIQINLTQTFSITCLTTLDGHLAIGTREGYVFICPPDLQSSAQIFTLSTTAGEVTCITPLSDGRLVTGSADGNIYIWSLKGKARVSWKAHHQQEFGPFGIKALTSFPDGRIACLSAKGEISIWTLNIEPYLNKALKMTRLCKKRKVKRYN